jgi:uncharacterized protein (DUF1697 family)
MTYVALLRGINVGGNRKVEMAKLKRTFEQLGFTSVKTFIASGNVVFCEDSKTPSELTRQIESAIEQDFGLEVPVLLRDLPSIERLIKNIPATWVNDVTMKCDVMFLQPGIDHPDIVKQVPHKPEIEDVIYLPGAVVWRVDRDKVNRGQVLKIIGTDMYKQLTVRNLNTVRKLNTLMQAATEYRNS